MFSRALMMKLRLPLDEQSHWLAPWMVAEKHQEIARINALGIAMLPFGQAMAGVLRLVSRAYMMEAERVATSASFAELAADVGCLEPSLVQGRSLVSGA